MIIGLVGFAGSGKDTVGDMLVDQGFWRDSFAKPVKDAVAAIFGWNRNKLEGKTKADRDWREIPDEYWSKAMGKTFSPRMALQLMGTEAGRHVFHADLWTEALRRRVSNNRIDQVTGRETNYVITDVRFINEMELIHDLGGHIIHITRGPRPYWYNDAANHNLNIRLDPHGDYPLPLTLQSVHISEWGWVESHLIDYVISNDGTLDELKSNLNELIDHLMIT